MMGGAGLIEWLARPWSGSTDHTIALWAAWHGRLMVLGWGVLAPVGLLMARYFKLWPGQDWPRELDNRHWWHAHRALAGLAIALATGAAWLAWRARGPSFSAHALAGWAALVLGWGQVAGGLLRGTKGGPTDPRGLRGDHFDMTKRRVAFERVHKAAGWLTLALGSLAIVLGLAAADAPRWMWLVIALWWSALAGAAGRLQHAGRCADTYHAIWGPDPTLPGNRRAPIGWGVVRYPESAE